MVRLDWFLKQLNDFNVNDLTVYIKRIQVNGHWVTRTGQRTGLMV